MRAPATMKSSSDITVAGICGSLREGSYARHAVRLALQGASEAGAQTRLIDLRDYRLPFCNAPGIEESQSEVDRLCASVREAQGIILGTPEYHGNVSGVLKNAIDLMGFDEFEGKLIGLVGVSGGSAGAFNALNTLRTIGRSLRAWVIPEQASIAEAYKHFDADGNITNEQDRARLLNVGRQVARFARLHHSQEAREFLEMWEKAVTNPGAK